MKRNNIFMWAYIVAIIFCMGIKSFIDYSMWKPIVLAVTVSSMFFSLEDLFSSIYRTLEESCNHADRLIFEVTQLLNEEYAVISKIDKKKKMFAESNHTYENTQELYNKLKSPVDKVKSTVENYAQKYTSIKGNLKAYRIITIVFAFLGYLVLFCILFFSQFIQLSTIFQEQLTVLSFAIILITQQINESLTGKIKKNANEIAYILKGKDESISQLRIIEKYIDKVSEDKEIPEMEALNYAH